MLTFLQLAERSAPPEMVRPYLAALEKFRTAIYAVQPLSKHVAEAHYLARNDILMALNRLKRSARNPESVANLDNEPHQNVYNGQ